ASSSCFFLSASAFASAAFFSSAAFSAAAFSSAAFFAFSLSSLDCVLSDTFTVDSVSVFTSFDEPIFCTVTKTITITIGINRKKTINKLSSGYLKMVFFFPFLLSERDNIGGSLLNSS
ncbi:hypothetical protein NT04LM_2890a, partial [Listeria monocytogenes FSL F2-208]